MKTLKELVAKGKTVRFVMYRKSELFYETDCGFQFPVPIEDIGDGVFLAEDKAILFMRYIRKHISAIEAEKVAMKAAG